MRDRSTKILFTETTAPHRHDLTVSHTHNKWAASRPRMLNSRYTPSPPSSSRCARPRPTPPVFGCQLVVARGEAAGCAGCRPSTRPSTASQHMLSPILPLLQLSFVRQQWQTRKRMLAWSRLKGATRSTAPGRPCKCVARFGARRRLDELQPPAKGGAEPPC